MNNDIGRLEGSGGARLINIIRRNARNIKDLDITIATVTKAPPNIAIRIIGDSFDLEGDDLVVSESLLNHTRTVSLTGGSVSINNGNLSVNSPLKVGDKVIVIIAQNGQLYYVIDKVV